MKKVINGLRYDTQSAVRLGGYESEGSRSDFTHWEANLYRAPRSGRYFLAGSGGPMTRYAVSSGQNSWSGGEDLSPMTEAEAFAWAQEYMDSSDVEAAFDHLVEEA